MHPYTAADTLRIAKRYNNPKRSYLLVNPLQAKHIPVSPAAALEMMGALGDQVAAKYPEARLVIGFAETATAIGAAVAARLGPDCLYVHTTREALDGDWILFREEHSHAAEHRLCADQLADWIDRGPAAAGAVSPAGRAAAGSCVHPQPGLSGEPGQAGRGRHCL